MDRIWWFSDVQKSSHSSEYMWLSLISSWKTIIPCFCSQMALTTLLGSVLLWSRGATCVRVDTAFYGSFSTKCQRRYCLATSRRVWQLLRFFCDFLLMKCGFATGRTAIVLSIWPLFWSLRVKAVFVWEKKNWSLWLCPPGNVVFFAFHIYIYIHINIYIYMYIYIYVYVFCVYIYIYVCVYINVCIYEYTYNQLDEIMSAKNASSPKKNTECF